MGTITRSLNNSLTIILMLTALSLLGGESIRWFAVALLIGAVTGTYSSTCTAVPLLYVWEEVARALRKRKTK
jgi:preprotein translocase subunit SecF